MTQTKTFILILVALVAPVLGWSQVATPTTLPGQGTYAATQSVSLTDATAGSTICYTTDGSSPTANGAGTCTHGTAYSTAITVASTTTIKALGSKSGQSDSAVDVELYTIQAVCRSGTYGVCGDPYEGGGAPASPTSVSACGTISSSGNYKVSQNIGTDPTATCLIVHASGVNLDLGGFTVTGTIYDQGVGGPGAADGNVIYNGTIVCNKDASTYPQACLNSYVEVTTTQYRLHHLVINQNNSNGKQIQIEEDVLHTYNGGGSGLGTQFRVDHIYWDSRTINNPLNNRYGSINIQNNPYSAEEDHIWLYCTNGSAFNDCQGMGSGGNAPGPQYTYIHDNYIQLDVSNIGDSARGVDCDFQSGHGTCDVYNNVIISTNNRAIRFRNSDNSSQYTQKGNIYGNTIQNIQLGLTGRFGAIHIGENDFTLEQAAINIYGNTFELNTGKAIYVAAATGVTAHDNTVTCYLGSCAGALDVLHTDGYPYALTGTSATIKNTTLPAGYTANAVIACGPAGNPSYVCPDSSTATSSVSICNTGTVVGNGTINVNCGSDRVVNHAIRHSVQ